MQDLSPPVLSAVSTIRWRIACGSSMKEALRMYLSESHTALSQRLREWLALREQSKIAFNRDLLFPSPYQKALTVLIERGLMGQPTLDHLSALEEEIERAAQAELESHVQALPFKVLIPLLIFQFPAYLLLLLGPLLRELQREMGG